MSKKSDYGRTKAAARKISEARKAALQGFAKVPGLFDRFAALTLDDLPEDENRHTTGYVGAILEFAAQHSQGHGSCGMEPGHSKEEHDDPRKFAGHFLSKRPEYSRNPNGLSASLFEAWLLESSGYLFSKFVETVLESGSKFTAVFEGKLNKEELRRMRTGTAPFMQFETLIEAGMNNGEEICEFTIFDCTAVKMAKKDVEPSAETSAPPKEGDVKLPGVAAGGRFESLLPDSREKYDAVYEEGGVTREALNIVLGEDAIASLVESSSGCRVVDANNVAWLSEDGDVWLPDVDSLDEYEEYSKPSQEPSGYRKYEPTDGGNCANCRFLRHKSEGIYCTLFAYNVESEMTCNSWGSPDTGLAEDDMDERERRAGLLTWDEKDEPARAHPRKKPHKFLPGDIVTYGGRRRYLIVSMSTDVWSLGLVALSGGDRGSAPSVIASETPQLKKVGKISNNGDGAEFVGKRAHQLHNRAAMHIATMKSAGRTAVLHLSALPKVMVQEEEARIVASDFGTWEIHESEDETIVVVGERACTVLQPFDEVIETVQAIGLMYEGMEAERDLMVEATLTDFLDECGEDTDAQEPVVESRRDERDELVETNNCARLVLESREEESGAVLPQVVRAVAERLGEEEATRLWEAAAESVSEDYPDYSPDSPGWHHVRVGTFRSLARVDEKGEAKKDDDTEDPGKKR